MPESEPRRQVGVVRSVLVRAGVVDVARRLPENVGALVRACRSHASPNELAGLVDAYQFAAQAHEGQFRRSGEPYITHPVEVALLLAEMGMDVVTVTAALLHDVVEDTPVPLSELVERYGSEVAAIVDGVTKIDKLAVGDAGGGDPSTAHAETLRKMLLAMAGDLRVLVVKLADRLHNMRTIGALPVSKQQVKASETLEVYAPLAHRLGMQQVKRELEDLSFAVLYPREYAEVVDLLDGVAPDRMAAADVFAQQILGLLGEAKIKGEVTGRGKHAWSVFRKMTQRGVPFDEIMDLMAVRIIVDDVRDCYAVLGHVHHRWTPVPGRFKDYVAAPRRNLYQSLHTVVMTDDGSPVEVQIRSRQMHAVAEWGVAAHWRYKYGAADAAATPEWVAALADWQREITDPRLYLEALRSELNRDEVYVLTPAGQIKTLPGGATPIDFAYAVHTEVGHRCVGAKVDGKLTSLDTPLVSGQVVEILTSKAADAGPSRDWLDVAVSQQAQAKIRGWFNRQRREHEAEHGRRLLSVALRARGMSLSVLKQRGGLDEVAPLVGRHRGDDVLRAIGAGELDADDVAVKLSEEPDVASRPGGEQLKAAHGSGAATGVLVDGEPGMLARTADCCHPQVGDELVGFVTRGRGVSVHREDCPNLTHLLEADPGRSVPVEWERPRSAGLRRGLLVEALDRKGLLRDMSATLTDLGVNILGVATETDAAGVARLRVGVELSSPEHLERVVEALAEVDAVFDVTVD